MRNTQTPNIMYPNYQNQSGQNNKPKKEKINVWEGVGIIRPRTANASEIQFYPFKNGGGVIHVFMKCSQPTGKTDESGQPRFKTVSVPVDVFTNATIQEQTLRNVIPGSKVKVVGELATQTFNDKQGQPRSQLVVNAFVFEIMESPMTSMPQYPPQPQYPQGMPQYPPQYQPQPQYPQGMPQYQPQPQYPQGMPQYPPQPQYPQGMPQYPPQPANNPAQTQQPPQYGQYGQVKQQAQTAQTTGFSTGIEGDMPV